MEKRHEEWQPRYIYSLFLIILILVYCIRWFRLAKHEITGQELWVSNEKYWQRNWANCPDIY